MVSEVGCLSGRLSFVSPYSSLNGSSLMIFLNVSGYQKLHQNVTQGKVDHHEGLDLYAPSPYPNISGGASTSSPIRSSNLLPLEGPNLWPTHPGQFKSTMERWIDKMKLLGMSVMRCMADGLGMSQSEWEGLRAMIDRSFWVMRVIGMFSFRLRCRCQSILHLSVGLLC